MDLSFDLGIGLSPSDMHTTGSPPSSSSAIAEENLVAPTQPLEKKKGRGAHKFNAKVVEVYDLEGNLFKTFPSCTEASKIMKATPVEVSQCCKGQKDNIRGFRYKFRDEDIQKKAALVPKRGYVIETVSTDSLPTASEADIGIGSRLSRATRGITEQVKAIDAASTKKKLLYPPEALPRKWTKVVVKIGHMFVPTWVPDSNNLNPILNPNKTAGPKSRPKRKR
jgi:hypothetical protein